MIEEDDERVNKSYKNIKNKIWFVNNYVSYSVYIINNKFLFKKKYMYIALK